MEVRKIQEGELPKLLALYLHLHKEDEKPAGENISYSWKKIIRSEFFHYFVIEKDKLLVSSCNLSIIPNLTRGARSIGLIENVVTHADFRRQGLGKKVLQHAIEFARNRDCYKVMLLSNTERKESHHFYKHMGFRPDTKSGFEIKF